MTRLSKGKKLSFFRLISPKNSVKFQRIITKASKKDKKGQISQMTRLWNHSEPEWNISNKNCLAWNIAQTYDFCIPLDLLDTKDLKKTFKSQKWPFNLNQWLFQLKILHMIHISWKNYEILKFWVLDFGFGLQNFFWPLKFF